MTSEIKHEANIEQCTIALIERPYAERTSGEVRQALLANIILPPKVLEPIRIEQIGSTVLAQL